MANITLLGASYTDVPAIDLPQTGGGTVRFYENGGGGGTPAISVVDTLDSHGGTIREITALDISDTTAVASDVAQGKYFYTALGVKTAGTGSGGSPSATAHTIYFEFSDNTNTTITAYWDDSFISDAITATEPTTYEQKTVTLAQLDGVEWYSYTPTPSGNYETIYDGTVTTNNGQAIISSLSDYYFAQNETYRVTIDGTSYVCETTPLQGSAVLGNYDLYNDITAEGDYPFLFFNAGWGGVYAYLQNGGSTNHTIKLEKQTSA